MQGDLSNVAHTLTSASKETCRARIFCSLFLSGSFPNHRRWEDTIGVIKRSLIAGTLDYVTDRMKKREGNIFLSKTIAFPDSTSSLCGDLQKHQLLTVYRSQLTLCTAFLTLPKCGINPHTEDPESNTALLHRSTRMDIRFLLFIPLRSSSSLPF